MGAIVLLPVTPTEVVVLLVLLVHGGVVSIFSCLIITGGGSSGPAVVVLLPLPVDSCLIVTSSLVLFVVPLELLLLVLEAGAVTLLCAAEPSI